MPCATFCLALQLLAPPPQPERVGEVPAVRDHDGPDAVTVPAPGVATDEAAVAAKADPGAAPEPAPAPAIAPGPAPVSAPVSASVSAAVAKTEPPRPKWWGPYPRPKLSGFGGPILQLSGLDRKFAAMVGLGGGLDIRRRVSIGAAALWLLNPSEAGTTSVGAPQRLNFNFGALLLSVVFARTKRVDFMVGGLIGGGGACLQNPDDGTCYARTAMFVGQPGLAAHIKLAPIVRLAVGLGYRFVAARAWTGPASGRLGAPLGSVMLEFGLF